MDEDKQNQNASRFSQSESKAVLAGSIGSGIWIGAVAIHAALDWGAYVEMLPHQWGSFFGGVAAPLAFLWLVVGYFQQSQELRQNSKLLSLQVEQLERQVAEMERHSEALRNAEDPAFIVTGAEDVGEDRHFTLRNEGGLALSPSVSVNRDGMDVVLEPQGNVGVGRSVTLVCANCTGPAVVSLIFYNKYGERRSRGFNLDSALELDVIPSARLTR